MSLPKVTITEQDGAVGVLPPSSGRLLALVGVSDSGTVDTPATFATKSGIISTFGAGPLVEAACYAVHRFGNPVVLVRTGQSVAGDEGTIDVTGVSGTSAITLDTAPPNDDYEAYWIAVTGGTIGTAGITFQWSLDGGRTLSPVTALGTAMEFVFPGTGGVNIDFGAGTIVAGDVVTFRTTAPNWNASELTSALQALAASSVLWELVHVVGPVDGAAFDAIELEMAAMAAAGKYRAWIGNARVPDLGESEATYLTALDTIFSAKVTTYGGLCAGAAKLTSSGPNAGRSYKRPVAFPYAPLEQSVSQQVNVAQPISPYRLAGVSIRDSNGNADEHDEALNPGLDDSRFTVLRTHVGIQGVYVNRPRCFSSAGSDFFLLPHRRVLNLANETLLQYFQRRLNSSIVVDATTGFILEAEALAIEAGALGLLNSVLLAGPKASGVQFTLSRTDNLLSTKTLTGEARVIPLGYPEFITLEVGFVNPALQVVTQ